MSRSGGGASSTASDQQICCLIDKGKKCKRYAGNASYNRRIQKLVFKHNLGLQIDDSVNHLYICDHHKNLIQDKSKHKVEKPKHSSSETKTNGRGHSSTSSSQPTPSTSSSQPPSASSSSRQSRREEAQNRNADKASQQQAQQTTQQRQSASARLKANDDTSPVDYDFMKMPISVLRRYKTHFKLPVEVGMTKVQMARMVSEHFSSWKVSEREVISYFLYTLKAGKNRLDRKNETDEKA